MKSIHFKSIDSTSSYLKVNYNKYKNLTFVSTDFQSKGHGRNGREWVSKEKENLLFSILIKDEDLIKKYDCLSLASSVCIYEVLMNLGIENVSIKWPNDVLVNDKKICGILLESVSSGSNIEALVLGVGLNVNSKEFSNMIIFPTSIQLETNKKISLKTVKKCVYEKFIKMFENIKRNESSYLDTIKNNNYLKNKKVYALIEGKKQFVEVIDINEDNSLKIKSGEEYKNVYSGEITFHV